MKMILTLGTCLTMLAVTCSDRQTDTKTNLYTHVYGRIVKNTDKNCHIFHMYHLLIRVSKLKKQFSSPSHTLLHEANHVPTIQRSKIERILYWRAKLFRQRLIKEYESVSSGVASTPTSLESYQSKSAAHFYSHSDFSTFLCFPVSVHFLLNSD